MLYDCKNPIVKIIGVEHMKWKGGIFHISPRQYAALAFRISGTATVIVNENVYHVNTNDVLYLPQNTPYTAKYSDTEMLVIHFNTNMDDKLPEIYTCSHSELLYKEFIQAHQLWEDKVPGYEAEVFSKLYHILGQLYVKESASSIPEYFLKALSYINSNYRDSNITIAKICKASNICATNLRVLFKKHYNKTPVEYITNLRLEYARSLISCGTSIEEAAEKSGFSDSKYFARVVKKYFNCTPSAFKLYGK